MLDAVSLAQKPCWIVSELATPVRRYCLRYPSYVTGRVTLVSG